MDPQAGQNGNVAGDLLSLTTISQGKSTSYNTVEVVKL
jgi:hypothetical protein